MSSAEHGQRAAGSGERFMSDEFPGSLLEDYLSDLIEDRLPQEGLAELERLVARYEPIRELVENWLETYERELCHGPWRAYRDATDWEPFLEVEWRNRELAVAILLAHAPNRPTTIEEVAARVGDAGRGPKNMNGWTPFESAYLHLVSMGFVAGGRRSPSLFVPPRPGEAFHSLSAEAQVLVESLAERLADLQDVAALSDAFWSPGADVDTVEHRALSGDARLLLDSFFVGTNLLEQLELRAAALDPSDRDTSFVLNALVELVAAGFVFLPGRNIFELTAEGLAELCRQVGARCGLVRTINDISGLPQWVDAEGRQQIYLDRRPDEQWIGVAVDDACCSDDFPDELSALRARERALEKAKVAGRVLDLVVRSVPPVPPASPDITSAQVSMEIFGAGRMGRREVVGLAAELRSRELRVVRSLPRLPSGDPLLGPPRLLDAPRPPPSAEEVERQRQKDVRSLSKILEARGVPRRLLFRCQNRVLGVVCDSYRVSGEPCVECGDGTPPEVA